MSVKALLAHIEKMEMARSCSEDAVYNDCKSGSILDARWEKKARKAKGDMAKNSGKRDGRNGIGHGTLWRSIVEALCTNNRRDEG